MPQSSKQATASLSARRAGGGTSHEHARGKHLSVIQHMITLLNHSFGDLRIRKCHKTKPTGLARRTITRNVHILHLAKLAHVPPQILCGRHFVSQAASRQPPPSPPAPTQRNTDLEMFSRPSPSQ